MYLSDLQGSLNEPSFLFFLSIKSCLLVEITTSFVVGFLSVQLILVFLPSFKSQSHHNMFFCLLCCVTVLFAALLSPLLLPCYVLCWCCVYILFAALLSPLFLPCWFSVCCVVFLCCWLLRMFNICSTYVQHMFNICLTYVWHMFDICSTYVPTYVFLGS